MSYQSNYKKFYLKIQIEWNISYNRNNFDRRDEVGSHVWRLPSFSHAEAEPATAAVPTKFWFLCLHVKSFKNLSENIFIVKESVPPKKEGWKIPYSWKKLQATCNYFYKLLLLLLFCDGQ